MKIQLPLATLVLVTCLTACRHQDKPQPQVDSTTAIDTAAQHGASAKSGGKPTGDSEILRQLTTSSGGKGVDEIERVPENSPEAKPPFPIKPLQASSDSQMRAKIPVGSMPIIPSARLHLLHPTLPGYVKDPTRVFSRDVPNVISKSVQIYRDVKDTNHTVRFEIIDQNEAAADKMIREITSMRANDGKQVSISPSGEARIAYLTEVNGMIGASCFIQSEQVATLALVVGDHRVVFLREQPATGREHLIELAKHFNTKKFESMH